jgi:hypothetical protein
MTVPMSADEFLVFVDKFGPAKIAALLHWAMTHPEAFDGVAPGHTLGDVLMSATSYQRSRIDEIVQLACKEPDPELAAMAEEVAIAMGLASGAEKEPV